MPDQFEQYYKYLKSNGADVPPDFNSFKNTLSDYDNASKYYSYLKQNKFDVPSNYDSFADTFGLKKKAGNSASLGILSPSPKESNFLQQGQKVASGEIFTDISKSVPKTTLKEAAIKDKNNNNSYLGAVWNNVVSSAERLAGGAARLAMKMDTGPVSMIQNAVDKAASSVTGINYQAQREKETANKFKDFIGKARSSASSKEYEQGLAKGFDITNGIGLDDIKGLGAALPSMIADMAIAAPTGGVSFGIQGYDDALSTLDDIPEGKYMSETTRTAFGLGGGIIAGVLEKLGMDNILKSGTATKYVTSKILQETAGELAKKGVKVTAEQFEKAVANKATQLLTKTALKNTIKAGTKSAISEGVTEATQEGAMDLLKLASNQLEGKKIFDEEDLKNTAASRYLNAAAMGGIFGGTLGSIGSRTKNVQQHIEGEVKNAKTQEDIASIVNEINENVKDGTISENDAKVFKSIVGENINKPSISEIQNEKETKISDIDEYINSLDKRDRLYNDKLNQLNEDKSKIISYYDDLSKKYQKDEEVSPDDGKSIPIEKNKALNDELRDALNYDFYESQLNSEDKWERENARKFLSDPKKYFESKIEIAKEGLSINPNNDSSKMLLEDNTEGLRIFNEITNKYKQNVAQEPVSGKVPIIKGETIPSEVKVTEQIKPTEKETPVEVKTTEEVTPTEFKVEEKVKDLSKFSEAELEKRQLEIEGLKSGTPESKEFNDIDKELEKREWRKVFDSPLDKVAEVADELIKKDKEQPNGYGSYIERSDARSLKYIADKYSKENVKNLTDSEIIKDYKDAMFGNPTSWYSDGLKLRESVKEAQNRGIDVFKELSKEFIRDGYSEQDAMDMAKRKLEPILKDLKQSSEKQIGLEQKVAEEVKPTEAKEAVESPKPVKEATKEEKAAQAYKDLTRNEKRQIINSKFDELIKELKIEKICPT